MMTLDATLVTVLDILWIVLPTGFIVSMIWLFIRWLGPSTPYDEDYPTWIKNTPQGGWTILKGGNKESRRFKALRRPWRRRR